MTACLCSLAAFCVGLALVLVALAGGGDGGRNDQFSPSGGNSSSSSIAMSSLTSEEAQAAQDEWLNLRNDILPEGFADSILLQPDSSNSPQVRALRWLSLFDSSSTTANLDSTQRYALAVLYFHWVGELWDVQGWIDNSGPGTITGSNGTSSTTPTGADVLMNECTWTGLTCNEDQTEIVALNLTNNAIFSSIGSTIPSELGLLTGLKILALPEHGLQGSLPDTVYSGLTKLVELDLRRNQLTSVMTPQLSNLEDLESLRLSHNQLRDAIIGSELRSLRLLRVFEVDNNLDLECSEEFIEESVSFWMYLERLDWSYTSMRTLLPHRTMSVIWPNLVEFKASRSWLEGTIPWTFGELLNFKVLALDHPIADSPGIEGSLHPQLSFSPSSLEYLNVAENRQLGSTLPTEFGQMTNLKEFYVEGTDLSGMIPSEFGNLSALEVFHVQETNLSGQIPSELGRTNLHAFQVEAARFVGSMPDELCDGRLWTTLTASCTHSQRAQRGDEITCDCCTMCIN